MACWHPGKIRHPRGLPDLVVPCRRCEGCIGRRRMDWLVRGCHELDSTVTPSSFLTLTYAPEYLPDEGTLCRRDIVNFLRRLRRRVFPLRHLTVGEYGDRTARPHYHAIIFGWQPDDLLPLPGHAGLYTSAVLSSLWGLGLVSVGIDVNHDTISYLTSYLLPRQDVKDWQYLYAGADADTGEAVLRVKPFVVPARPGLGRAWWLANVDEVLRTDGKVRCSALPGPLPVPSYYVSLCTDEQRERLRDLTGSDHNYDRALRSAATSASKKRVLAPCKPL